MDNKSYIEISDEEDDADISVQVIGEVKVAEVDTSVQVIGELRPSSQATPAESSFQAVSESKSSSYATPRESSSPTISESSWCQGVFEEPSSQPIPQASQSPAKQTKALQQAERNRLKQERQREKELERVRKEANRANTANKATQNCTAIIDRKILKLINDPEEANFKTLFEESSLNYRITDFPIHDNCIEWQFKRAEVEENSCVIKTKETDLILVVMDGGEYVKKILLFRDDPHNPQSLNNFIRDLRQKSQSMIVILVYNLNAYLRAERAKETKDYQKKFKQRFEAGGGNTTDTSGNNGNKSNTNPADLEELRLTLQIELEHNNQDWKVHIEFREKTVEVVDSIVKYTKSTANREIKKKEKASTMLDWAINMDKDKAHDPTKSKEELTCLWITQLQQFSQITLPIAKTIAAEYPSPSALLDQYQSLTQSEAQDLLAELHVQRNLRRQVGQNISRRIYRFLTSSDPDFHIGFD